MVPTIDEIRLKIVRSKRYLGESEANVSTFLRGGRHEAMGAWGTAIFSDDTACDVRDGYIDLLGDGLSGPEATKKLVGEWSESLEDPGEAPVFWLALATTQWKYGRLEPDVLQPGTTTELAPDPEMQHYD